MKAIILAAGRGERMRPLTDNCPKPMLKVAGIPLIEHHIQNLKRIGVVHIVINLAWCGNKVVQYFGAGEAFGISIEYSDEKSAALETAGGIKKALSKLIDDSEDTFIVVNGDVFTRFNLQALVDAKQSMSGSNSLAHIVLVDNPPHNIKGDFQLNEGKVSNIALNDEDISASKSFDCNSYTYSGIGLYRKQFFQSLPEHDRKAALGPMLKAYADEGLVEGSFTSAMWTDVGTPERLKQLNLSLEG